MSDPDHAELESVTGGRYEIEGFLAQGGMGKVYTGRNRSLGSRVAIKVLPTEVATSDVRLARFKREAALAANLSHPNIVPVFEFDATPGLAYLVMPFVEGQTLAQELAERGQLEVAEVRRLIDDVGKALAFAHKNGVIHRDIKPANLIRETATDRWLVTDFGVAHSARPEETEITQTGVVVGTPAYMPPEQATGIGVDPRTDLYSLAVVAFQALCGLGYDDLADCLTKGRSTLERVLAMAQPRMRSALVKALVWPLEKVPDERPQSAESWLETLMEAERTQSLYRWAWAAAAASLAIAAFIMFRPAPTTPTPTSPAIAVAPFRGDISGSSGDLSIANLADLFDWQLKYLPNHRVMGASFRREAESRFRSAPAETDALIQLARERGATMLVEGRAGSRGDLLTLEILVYEVASERRVASADTAGPADSLDALVSALVITAFAERDALQLSGWKRALPKGLEATTAFLQGNLDLRRGSYRNAADQYNEVIRRDSTFAPAHFNRMFALMFGGRPSEYSVHVRSGLEGASAHREDLDPLSQRILEGYRLLLEEGDLSAAEQLAQEVVRANPEAVDAWFLLGFVQFHFGGLIGKSLAEAQYQFQQAVHLDSSFAIASWYLGSSLLLQQENERAEQAYARLLAVDSTSVYAEQARVVSEVVFQRNIMGVLESFSQSSINALEVISASLGVLNPPPASREVMSEALSELWRRSSTPYDLRLSFRMRMAQLLAEGKWASAVAHLEDGARRRVPRDELDRWVVLTGITPLPDLAPESAQLAGVQRLLDDDPDVVQAHWLAARWYLQNNRTDAEAAVAGLREIADSSTSSPLAVSLLLDIDATRSLARGDSLAADTLWARATRFYQVDDIIYGLTASLWPLRLSRTVLAAKMGNHAAAVERAETFSHMAGFTDQAAWPFVLPLLAESYLAIGNPLRAREVYSRLGELLEDADGDGMELQEEVRVILAEYRN